MRKKYNRKWMKAYMQRNLKNIYHPQPLGLGCTLKELYEYAREKGIEVKDVGPEGIQEIIARREGNPNTIAEENTEDNTEQ